VNSGTVPNEPVLLALQRTTHVTLHRLSAELADLELTASEINVLANLADSRGRTVSELGAAVGTRSSTLTGVLDRLERRGHIARVPSPGDRRSVVIEPTETGRRNAQRIRRTIGNLERRALSGLPGEAVAGFHAVLAALVEVSA